MPSRSRALASILGVSLAVLAASHACAQPWQLVFADEFTGTSIDTTKWNVRNAPGQFNNELQYYSPDEVSVAAGLLTLRSQRRNLGGRQFTSGLVETRGKFAQRYGRVEVRARLPRGQGIWPAHWMLPESGIWPPEIDIMELLGHDPFTVYMTNHWGVLPQHSYRTGSFTGPDFSQGFHTFAVEWTPTRIEWYVDDVIRFANIQGVPTSEPFYIILNTAVGGIWPGNPDHTTVFPQFHEIDYVRVFTRADPGTPIRTITDYTPAGALADGVLSQGEYITHIHGINSGWGDRIGAASQILLDSDPTRLYLAIDGLIPWPPSPTPDGVVFYIDSQPGGATSTITINDASDLGRALVSGNGRTTGVAADLFFADGFTADFAVFLQDTFAGIFRIEPSGSLSFVTGINLNAPFDVFGGTSIRYVRSASDPTFRELRLRLADINIAPAASFRFVATMLNGDTAARSNEYFGVAPGNPWDATPSTTADVQLKPGDFITMFVHPQCLGDFDRSGTVTSQDFFEYLAEFFAGRGDVNNDLVTDSQDFFQFIQAFFTGC